MRCLLIITALIAAALLLAGCTLWPSNVDRPPAQVLPALDAAMNAHDANAVLALFDKDAIVTVRPDYVYRGVSEIRDWLNAIQLGRLHVEGRSTKFNGDTVTRVVRHTWDHSHTIEAFQNEIVIRQGRIVSYSLDIQPPPPRPTPASGAEPEVEP